MTDMTQINSTRLVMVCQTTNSPVANGQEAFRQLHPDDGDSLGRLMYQAYKDTVDDEGETIEESIAEADATLKGKYGRPILEASLVTESPDMLTSAIVITDYPKTGPLIAFVLTAPSYQKRGLASQLMKTSLQTLAQLGINQVRLVVTEQNTRAMSLYLKLGFQIESVKSSGGLKNNT